jgi:hypothetical protein
MNKLLIAFITFLIIAPILTGCSWLSANPHTDVLIIPPDTIEVETPTAIEDVRG